MEKSNMTYNDALEFMSNDTDAKLEHLLLFNVFYCENKDTLLNFIPEISDMFWKLYEVNLSYSGYATMKNDKKEDDISEVYFRTDEVITKDQVQEVFEMINTENICMLGAVHKTMLVNEWEDLYENIEYHWSINSYQAFYNFTNEEMFNIFGKDAGLFSEPEK